MSRPMHRYFRRNHLTASIEAILAIWKKGHIILSCNVPVE